MDVVVERKKFEDILKVAKLGGELETAQMVFGTDAVVVNVRNPANSMGAYAKFDPNYFVSYSVEEELKVAFPLQKLSKLLKVIRDDELSLSVTDSAFVINDGKIEVPLTTYDPNRELPSGLQLQETEYGMLFVSKSKGDLADKYNFTRIQIPKRVNLLNVEDVIFAVKQNTLILMQEDEIGHKFRDELASLMDKYVADAEVRVSAALMKHAFDTMISGECVIALGNDEGQPLFVQLLDQTAEFSLTVLVAPKLPE
jgi:hypothetical protein